MDAGEGKGSDGRREKGVLRSRVGLIRCNGTLGSLELSESQVDIPGWAIVGK